MLAKVIELLTRIGIVRLLIATKAFSSLVSGYIASRIRSHSKRVYEAAKYGVDKSLEVNGYNIHYAECGEGEPLLLLPGTFSTYRSWNRVLPLLGPGFKVLSIDYIGAGSSDKPKKGFSYTIEEQADIVAHLIKKLDLGIVSLAGVSYGGSIALKVATRYPELVNRVVCIEGGMTHPKELPRVVEALLRIPVVGDLLVSILKINIFNRFLMKWLMGKWYPDMTPEDKLAVLDDLSYDTAGATRISWYRLSTSCDVCVEQHEAVSVPVLYLYGKQSAFVEVLQKNVEFFGNYVPGAKIVAFADGIHDLHLQKPQEVAAIIQEFCAR